MKKRAWLKLIVLLGLLAGAVASGALSSGTGNTVLAVNPEGLEEKGKNR